MLVKIWKYTGFCVYRRSYLIWSPVIGSRDRYSQKDRSLAVIAAVRTKQHGGEAWRKIPALSRRRRGERISYRVPGNTHVVPRYLVPCPGEK